MYVTPNEKATWQEFQSFSSVNDLELVANIDFWPSCHLTKDDAFILNTGQKYYFGIVNVHEGSMFVDFVGHPYPINLHPHGLVTKIWINIDMKCVTNQASITLKKLYSQRKVKFWFSTNTDPQRIKNELTVYCLYFTNFLWTPLPAFSSSVPRLVGWTFYYSFLSFPAQPGGSCFPSVVSWLPKICFDKLQTSVYC